ncbi:uncharacterized protein LOC123592450 [Leopardus geoffroyi]|uniref:uncharacterized protein LOC123592450 n=1 Tax=Leopardus geoffroyi TaxID=46844 RepID=UPI001E26020A|nr:uncharacterized protein LOC123592450 [Leopardus geoffroyi]
MARAGGGRGGGGGAGEPAWLGPSQSGSPWQARPVFLLSQSVERRTEQAAHAPAPGHPGGPRTLQAVPEAGPGTRRLHTSLLPGARPPGAHHVRCSEPSQPRPCLCCAGVIGLHGHLGNPPPPLHPPCQRSYGELLQWPPWVAESYPVPVACLAADRNSGEGVRVKQHRPLPCVEPFLCTGSYEASIFAMPILQMDRLGLQVPHPVCDPPRCLPHFRPTPASTWRNPPRFSPEGHR